MDLDPDRDDEDRDVGAIDRVEHPEFSHAKLPVRQWVLAQELAVPGRNLGLVGKPALDLVEAVLRDPFGGIGKPEPLNHLLAGAWSRRITQEHRLVYLVQGARVDFLQARFHY